MIEALFCLIALVALGSLGLAAYLLMNKQPAPVVTPAQIDTSIIASQLREQHIQTQKRINDMPEDLMKTLIGTLNTHKGKLGELVGYLSLKAEYDRIIPLGNIVDFVGIKFPTESSPGYVDFIDIKTGDAARLNKDQKALRSLLTNKLINFKTIKIDSSEGLPDVGTDTDK
jgi:predicted Holliday junction resolvase-like endonuclease